MILPKRVDVFPPGSGECSEGLVDAFIFFFKNLFMAFINRVIFPDGSNIMGSTV